MTIELIKDVTKGNLHTAYARGTFHYAKQELEKEGYRVISLEELAGLRVGDGLNLSVISSWTREGFIYVPDGVFLTKNSPIIENSEAATKCHGNGDEFYLNDEQVKKALADSVKVTDRNNNYVEIPTKRFAECPITNFAFGKHAKAYGEFLKKHKIYTMPMYLAKFIDKPFARQAWLCRIGINESSLDGVGNLFTGGYVLGIR
ncbi:MAG: hypothetical protein QXS38_00475 [Candidatus Pacearchaeota archaeon]